MSTITPAGRVANNVTVDLQAIRARQDSTHNSGSLYGRSTDPTMFASFKGEILIEFDRGNDMITPEPGIEAPRRKVLTVLNGTGTKKDQREELCNYIDRMRYVGICGTASTQIVDNKPTHTELVAILGGLYTIPNTGRFAIRAGDKIMWQPPDDFLRPVIDREHRNSDRVVVWTVPFNDATDVFSAKLLRSWMMTGQVYDKQTLNRIRRDGRRNTRMEEAAKAIDQTMRMAVLVGVAAIARAPVNELDDMIAHLQAIRDARALGDHDTASDRQNTFVHEFADTKLGLVDKDIPDPTSDYLKDVRNMVVAAKGFDLFEPDPATGAVPSNDRGELCKKQKGMLQFQVTAVRRANRAQCDRIIGEAQTPAAPGNNFDVLLGNYCVQA
jgi:hypothetical protein